MAVYITNSFLVLNEMMIMMIIIIVAKYTVSWHYKLYYNRGRLYHIVLFWLQFNWVKYNFMYPYKGKGIQQLTNQVNSYSSVQCRGCVESQGQLRGASGRWWWLWEGGSWWISPLCDVGGREFANWRPGGKSCSLMPLPLRPPAQTPCLIYFCIYPLPPNPNTGPQNTPKV